MPKTRLPPQAARQKGIKYIVHDPLPEALGKLFHSNLKTVLNILQLLAAGHIARKRPSTFDEVV